MRKLITSFFICRQNPHIQRDSDHLHQSRKPDGSSPGADFYYNAGEANLSEWIYEGEAAASVTLDSTGPRPEVFFVEIVFGRISNVV